MNQIVGIMFSVLVAFLADKVHAAAAVTQIDLRLFPFASTYYEISDAWDFYPGEILSPDEIQNKTPAQRLSLVAIVPRENKMGALRHGTFRMQLRLPEPAYRYALFFPELRSASRIWINGKQIVQQGQVGSSRETEKPAIKPLIHILESEEQVLDIVIQLSAYSNYQFMSSSTPISIGHPKRLFEKHQAAKIRDSFVVGAIFIMAFYHFSLFALRRERIDPLLFGLFCLAIGVRTISRSEGFLLYQLFEQPEFHWQYRFEYWGISIPTAICAYFIYILFHKSISRRVVQTIVAISLLYTLCIGFLPLSSHGVLLIPFEIIMLMGACYLVKCLVQAKPEQRDGALLIACGFGAFILTIVNDILKNHGLMKTTTLSHIGLFLFILFQAILISKRFSRAFHRIKEAELEIRQMNDDLERKFQERTQTIRIILDNVKAGFLLIGSDLTIKEGFTRSCQDIVGRPIIVGQKLQELLELNERERTHFQLAVSQIFDNLLPDDVSLSQIHSRIAIEERIISLQGSIVRSDDRSVHAILFTITDVSGLVKAEREAQINRTLLSIIQDKSGFEGLMADSMRELKHAEEAWARGESDRLRMILHTLKGNFATYGLDDMARLIHRIEDLDDIGRHELDEVDSKIKLFIANYKDLIGLDHLADGNQGVFVAYEAFDKLVAVLRSMRAPDDIQRVFEIWVLETKLVPIRTLFGAMLTHIGRLAAHLGKDVDIHISGGELMVNPEKMGPVISNISHLLRNAVDHGIEIPEKRGAKHPRARIDLQIGRTAEQITITVADDGRGLDLDRIRDIAIEKGLFTQESFEKASAQEKTSAIFLPGFSTATFVSEISGRGVGMSSLLAAVQQLGGHVDVFSKKGQGCRFEISIPDVLVAPLTHKVA